MKRMWSILAVAATSVFSVSAGMLSGPAALPLLICLMAMLVSSIVGGPTSIGMSVGATSMLGGFSGADRFKSYLECSTHLFCCSSMLVITSPSLLFTGRSGLRRFPESFFVMSYSCLMFPSLAAFSAVVAKSSTYLRLSILILLFLPFVYFCVFSLCFGFFCSCLTGIDCCLLVPSFLNLIQCINSDPFLVMVLLVTQDLMTC
ncbi:unnamed protein product [Schistosoma margrebowiei]|uniref:SLC26A/SulP transporter domain-containing protein n=1 Tax=Schistosoma margrebowiei TaxID=48269 RepID=A0A3P8B620_9TREM|nr:unnamed protein product [Schistosoma margrebowiei]